MKIEKITCIQLRGEFPDFCTRLAMPDYGLPLIGTILSESGYDVKVYIENIKPPEWERIEKSDLICFSSWNAAADKTYSLAGKIRSRFNIPIVIGGVHASYFPATSLQFCDYIVFGEGDETIVELIETLKQGRSLDQVAGIAYRIGNRVHRTAPRNGPTMFDTIPDYSLIAGYRRMGWFNMLLQRKKPVMTAQSSRGCPFNCTFCIVNTVFPGGYRTKDVKSVIKDLRDKRQYGRELIFVDNEFAADRFYAKRLLKRIIEEDLDFKIVVFARVEIIGDTELLSMMRQAGITHIYQGYESVQPETLVSYRKRQTLEQIVTSIEKLQSFGFGILASFVLGADTDSLETIKRTIDFVTDQKLSNAYFWPLWGHFPEEKSGFHTIIPWYRGIFRGWRYCDGHFVNHFPLKIPPSKLQKAIIEAYRAVYSTNQILHSLKDHRFIDAKSKMLHRYQWRDIEKGVRDYIPFLEELEEGLYDSKGHLYEDILIQRVEKDPRWTFQAGNQTIAALGQSPPDLPLSVKQNIFCFSPKPVSSRFSE